MKKPLVALCMIAVLACISILPGCSRKNTTDDKNPSIQYGDFKPVKQFGQIPDAFKSIIENNAFHDITAFERRLMKSEIISVDKGNRVVTHKIQMMDVYGNILAEHIRSSDDAYHISTMTATEDGGFLFVLGFSDYAYGQNAWASDKGFASRVIKCDKTGTVQFDTPFNGVEGWALRFCFEKDGQFYLFGEIQTPETKKQGIHSRTDIYMVILNENGAVLKKQCIAGSDYDYLDAAEISGNDFVLSISSQSDDGAFAGSNSNGYRKDWLIKVNSSLEIIEKKKETGRDYFDYRIGEKDGIPIYQSDVLIDGFSAGTPNVYINYGDFYLIVSENNTGVYENTPPEVSAIWYHTETVYSAYNQRGTLIFRASVDSTPDYDT